VRENKYMADVKISNKKCWVVFDARYNTNPDRAIIMFATESEKEARKYAKDYPGSVVEYI